MAWHAFETQLLAIEADPGELDKPEAAPPAFAAKARKARFDTFLLYSPKEALISFIQAFQRRALQAYRNCRRLRIRLTPFGQRLALVDEASAYPVAVRADTLFESCVVEHALGLEQRF